MAKRSNPSRNVPHPAPFGGGGVDGMRSRSDFAGSTARLKRRTRSHAEWTADTAKRSDITAPKPPLASLGCARHEILHVCSGALPRGEGTRVDIRPAARPDILADGRALPIASGSIKAVMIDPPYCEEYAQSLYGVEYPRPKALLTEAARVVRPGGRIAFVHYIVPRAVEGTRRVWIRGMSTGENMPMRAVTLFERDQAELALGVG